MRKKIINPLSDADIYGSFCTVSVVRSCPCRLKKELEGPVEVPEPVAEENAHQKLRDVRVKGAPGTKVESMKVD